jgi:hypothetical protein
MIWPCLLIASLSLLIFGAYFGCFATPKGLLNVVTVVYRAGLTFKSYGLGFGLSAVSPHLLSRHTSLRALTFYVIICEEETFVTF